MAEQQQYPRQPVSDQELRARALWALKQVAPREYARMSPKARQEYAEMAVRNAKRQAEVLAYLGPEAWRRAIREVILLSPGD